MKIIIKVLVSILAVIAIIIGGWKVKEQVEYNQMVEIVKSEEVQTIIEERIKYFDKEALSKGGVIKSYRIDINSISKSPMGGINFHVFLNSDSDLRLVFELEKNDQTGKIEYAGGGYSAEIKELIKGLENE